MNESSSQSFCLVPITALKIKWQVITQALIEYDFNYGK